MAHLLNTWSAHNYVEVAPLETEFTYELLEEFTTGTSLAANWKVTRTRTKEYKYVGLSRAGAIACMNEKNEQYIRKLYRWRYEAYNHNWTNDDNPAGAAVARNDFYIKGADISAQCSEGGVYTVTISVNEVVEGYVRTDPPAAGGVENLNPPPPDWNYLQTTFQHLVSHQAVGYDWDYDEEDV